MAQCVKIIPAGNYQPSPGQYVYVSVPTIVPDSSCQSGLVIYSISDTIPDGTMMVGTFATGFTIVLSCFLIAKYAGSVLSLIRGR